MGEDRVNELLRRATREPKSVLDEEAKYLDFMEWSLARAPACDRRSLAKRRGKWLAQHQKMWANWFAAAQTNPQAWDAVQALVAELRQRDRTLLFIGPVFDWILDGFLEIRTRPTRRGRDPSTNLFRDSAIGATINEIRDLGIRPATSEKPGWSACHLVAKRVGLSYEAVRSIWLRQKRWFEHKAVD